MQHACIPSALGFNAEGFGAGGTHADRASAGPNPSIREGASALQKRCVNRRLADEMNQAAASQSHQLMQTLSDALLAAVVIQSN